MEKDEEIEKMVSKDFRQQSIILWAVAIAGMMILNTMILINLNDLKNQEDDLSTYDLEDMRTQLNAIATQLSNHDSDMNEIRNLLRNLETTITIIDAGDPKYPEDYVYLDFKSPESYNIQYYDNLRDEFIHSPTFKVDNWTDLMNWTVNEGEFVFTLHQRQTILLIGVNMAYYKETGTWLGE